MLITGILILVAGSAFTDSALPLETGEYFMASAIDESICLWRSCSMMAA